MNGAILGFSLSGNKASAACSPDNLEGCAFKDVQLFMLLIRAIFGRNYTVVRYPEYGGALFRDLLQGNITGIPGMTEHGMWTHISAGYPIWINRMGLYYSRVRTRTTIMYQLRKFLSPLQSDVWICFGCTYAALFLASWTGTLFKPRIFQLMFITLILRSGCLWTLKIYKANRTAEKALIEPVRVPFADLNDLASQIESGSTTLILPYFSKISTEYIALKKHSNLFHALMRHSPIQMPGNVTKRCELLKSNPEKYILLDFEDQVRYGCESRCLIQHKLATDQIGHTAFSSFLVKQDPTLREKIIQVMDTARELWETSVRRRKHWPDSRCFRKQGDQQATMQDMVVKIALLFAGLSAALAALLVEVGAKKLFFQSGRVV